MIDPDIARVQEALDLIPPGIIVAGDIEYALDRLAARLRATEIGMLSQEITDELARLQDKLREAEQNEHDWHKHAGAASREAERANRRAQRLELENRRWLAWYFNERNEWADRAEAAEAREKALRGALEPLLAAVEMILSQKPTPVPGSSSSAVVDIKDGLYALQQALGAARTVVAEKPK